MAQLITIIGLPAIVNSIATLSGNVFTLLGYIRISKNHHTIELVNLLEKSDIEASIELVQKIITDFDGASKSSVVFAVDKIREIIGEIETELKDIHSKITYNSSLYLLQNMRSFDCGINLLKMETKIAIFDKRMTNLFRLLPVHTCLSPSHLGRNENPS
jgi:hypothetical protein